MTTIVYNTETLKVAYRFTHQPTNDELNAACEAVPNAFAEELQNLKLTELAGIYNATTGSDIKKFANKTTAVERVENALVEAEVPEYDGKAEPAPVRTTLAEGVARSWTDPDVRRRRSERHGVKVNGEEFPSLQAAYRHFGLDEKDHREFRKELKANEGKAIKRHGKSWVAFKRS